MMLLRRLFGRRRASCRATAADTSPPRPVGLPGSPAEAAGMTAEPDPGRWITRLLGQVVVGALFALAAFVLADAGWFQSFEGDRAITVEVQGGAITAEAKVVPNDRLNTAVTANGWPTVDAVDPVCSYSNTSTTCDIAIAVKLGSAVPSEAGNVTLTFDCPVKPSGWSCGAATSESNEIDFTTGNTHGGATVRLTFPQVVWGDNDIALVGTWS